MELIFDGFWDQKCDWCENDRSLKNLCFPYVFCYFSRFGRSKSDRKSMKNRPWILDQFLDRFLMHLGVDFGVIFGPKIDLKSMLKFDCFLDAFWEGSGAAFSIYHGIKSIVSDNLGGPGGG